MPQRPSNAGTQPWLARSEEGLGRCCRSEKTIPDLRHGKQRGGASPCGPSPQRSAGVSPHSSTLMRNVLLLALWCRLPMRAGVQTFSSGLLVKTFTSGFIMACTKPHGAAPSTKSGVWVVRKGRAGSISLRVWPKRRIQTVLSDTRRWAGQLGPPPACCVAQLAKSPGSALTTVIQAGECGSINAKWSPCTSVKRAVAPASRAAAT